MSAVNAQVMPRLDVALGAVVEQRTGRLDLGRGVGEVVGEHLVPSGPPLAARWRTARADHACGEFDDVGGSGEIGCGHGGELY